LIVGSMEIVILSFLLTFFGFLVGIVVSRGFKKSNRFVQVTPGQVWFLPSIGSVQIAHILSANKDVVYTFKNIDDTAYMSGICSSKEIKKSGMLLNREVDTDFYEAIDEIEYPVPDLRVLEFPGNSGEEEEE